jgi:two-component system OmpR family response regulator
MPIDGAYGLLEAQRGGYDVYVVDRMMPRLDGIGMVETLRKDGDQTPSCSCRRWARSRTGSRA